MTERPTRFRMGQFKSVADAKRMLEICEVMVELNKSAMRGSSYLIGSGSQHANEIEQYALSVMADQDIAMQDVEELRAIVAEMESIEGLVSDVE